jgi:hypothetical protein
MLSKYLSEKKRRDTMFISNLMLISFVLASLIKFTFGHDSKHSKTFAFHFPAVHKVSATAALYGISNYVTLNGTSYAVLADLPVDGSSAGCQSSFMSVPSPWHMAASNPETLNMIKAHSFSTSTVILANGKGHTTLSSGPVNSVPAAGWNNASSGDNWQYKPSSCAANSQILITCRGCLTPAITNIVNYNGTNFATIANVNPDSNSATCQTTTVFYHLPIGWQIAKRNALSIEAIRKYRWATSCLLVADGTAWGTAKYSSSNCLPSGNYLRGNDFLGYSVAGCSLWVFIQPSDPLIPTCVPTAEPSVPATAAPTANPTKSPTSVPTLTSSVIPSFTPSTSPVSGPVTHVPTLIPTVSPSVVPTVSLTLFLSTTPTIPSFTPSASPTHSSSSSFAPSNEPTVTSTVSTSVTPSALPSVVPSIIQSFAPSFASTAVPSIVPTTDASSSPTASLLGHSRSSANGVGSGSLTDESRVALGVGLGIGIPILLLAGILCFCFPAWRIGYFGERRGGSEKYKTVDPKKVVPVDDKGMEEC